MAGKLEGDFLYYFNKHCPDLPNPIHYYCYRGSPDAVFEYSWPQYKVGIMLKPMIRFDWVNEATAEAWIILQFDREMILKPFDTMEIVRKALELRRGMNRPEDPLTLREVDLLYLLAGGLTTIEIAERLNLKENTVKVYAGKICQKLGVRNRTSAVSRAIAIRAIHVEQIPWPEWVEL